MRKLREESLKIMEVLSQFGPILHGSVARGDVDEDSDIDIFLTAEVRPFLVEHVLRESGFEIFKREVILATPWHLPKGHIYLDVKKSVSFALMKPTPNELDFYYFGGAIDLNELLEGKRKAGVDKRLMLIEPTDFGHVESSICGREGEVAKKLGVGLQVVRERIQVLTRRSEIGHTGVYFSRVLLPSESFEEVFEELLKKIRCRR